MLLDANPQVVFLPILLALPGRVHVRFMSALSDTARGSTLRLLDWSLNSGRENDPLRRVGSGDPAGRNGSGVSHCDCSASGVGPLRAVRWTAAWSLPGNHDAYRILALRRSPPDNVSAVLAPVAALLTTSKQQRTASRLVSCLLQHEPRLASFPWLPYLCVAMSAVFANSPTLALEAALHFLTNIAPGWLQLCPAATPPNGLATPLTTTTEGGPSTSRSVPNPARSIAALAAAVTTAHPALAAHLHRIPDGPTVADLLADALFSWYLDHHLAAEGMDWLQLVEPIFTQPHGDEYFWRLATVLLVGRAPAMLKCTTASQVVMAARRSPLTPRLGSTLRLPGPAANGRQDDVSEELRRRADAIPCRPWLPATRPLPVAGGPLLRYPVLPVPWRVQGELTVAAAVVANRIGADERQRTEAEARQPRSIHCAALAADAVTRGVTAARCMPRQTEDKNDVAEFSPYTAVPGTRRPETLDRSSSVTEPAHASTRTVESAGTHRSEALRVPSSTSLLAGTPTQTPSDLRVGVPPTRPDIRGGAIGEEWGCPEDAPLRRPPTTAVAAPVLRVTPIRPMPLRPSAATLEMRPTLGTNVEAPGQKPHSSRVMPDSGTESSMCATGADVLLEPYRFDSGISMLAAGSSIETHIDAAGEAPRVSGGARAPPSLASYGSAVSAPSFSNSASRAS